MRIVFTIGDAELERTVCATPGLHPTVGDLLEALSIADLPLDAGVLIDERFVDRCEPLAAAGIVEGCHVRISEGPAPAPPRAEVTLAVTAGLEAGRRFPLAAGDHLLGREGDVALSAASVSRRHCRLTVASDGDVTIADLGSRNGTRCDGAWIGEARVRLDPAMCVEIGSVHVAIEPAIDDAPAALPAELARRLSPCPVAPFNRPPRPRPTMPPGPLVVPASPAASASRQRLSWIAIVGPLLFGAAAAILFDPMMAIFAALSPIMALGGWLGARSRYRGDRRRGRRAFAAAVDQFAADVADAHRDACQRRRAMLPHPAEVLRRAETPSVKLWERRVGHPDLLVLHAGVGAIPWRPSLDGNAAPDSAIEAVLADRATLPSCPVAIDLSEGGVVGIVGSRDAALALARSLVCQAAVLHGPADVRIAAAVDPSARGSWQWLAWLPHSRDQDRGADGRLFAAGRDELDALAPLLDREVARDATGPVLLTVVDGDDLLAGRSSPVRALLRGVAGPSAGIVITSAADRLPAMCTTVVEICDPEGVGRVMRPQAGELLDDVLIAGVDQPTAARCARLLARWDDPELPLAGVGLPDEITLLDVLELPAPGPAAIQARWMKSAGSIAAPVGVDDEGVVVIDLVTDGPHALIGGTTGSGKSELLRSLVVSMAATADPEHLTFVLVDYKGGSAFDACARLPHTVGLVTDLDDQLAERALRCLDAEIRHRERLLRTAGVADLPAYLDRRRKDQAATVGLAPLPRLVVVVDEFATLAAELPDFLASLVSVAQRGRSLGVHLVLATQRPSGAVSDSIRTNTNLRIALRVLDRADSTDVIGSGEAALIRRGTPGRGYARLGPSELLAFQSAICSNPPTPGTARPVTVAPLRFGRSDPAPPRAIDAEESELRLLVDAITDAFSSSEMAAPRRPWPDPLPTVLAASDLDSTGSVAPLGLADDPENQRHLAFGWEPERGNLLIDGTPGSGATTALAAAAIGLAARFGSDELHIYALDFGPGDLAPLADLPHTGAVIGAAERERQVRLLGTLRSELDHRRSQARGPRILVLVDNIGALQAELGDGAGLVQLEMFQRIAIDGAPVGIHLAITADRAGAITSPIAATATQRLVLRLADPIDAATVGLRVRANANLPPGRGWWVETGLAVQVALPHVDGLRAAVAAVALATPASSAAAPRIDVLPSAISMSALASSVTIDEARWFLPIGVGDRELAPVGLRLGANDHALIAGPPRSGKSTVLRVLGDLTAASGAEVLVLANPRSPLASAAWHVLGAAELASLPEQLAAATGPWLLLIDDVEGVDDAGGHLRRLLATPLPGGRIVAAGRPDRIRSAYGSWVQDLRESRTGAVLRPNLDLDGDLWQTPLPRRPTAAMTAGRGFVVADGEAELFQAATP